jgi:hypothetical protein
MSNRSSNVAFATNEKVLLLLGTSRLKFSAIAPQHNRKIKADSLNVQPQ